MSAPMSMTDEEMVAKAQGTDVPSANKCRRLIEPAGQAKNWRMHSFSDSRERRLLRRIVRSHGVIRTKTKYCALCA